MSRLRLTVAAALALVLVLPATVLAATFDVGGTITNADGTPGAGVEITILVQGTDTILATTTDETGAWTLQLDAEPGAVLEVNATGPSVASEPDGDGCVTTTTPSGQTNATLPAEGAVPPIDVPLDNPITGTVCSETAAPQEEDPDTDAPAAPALTPPSTDTIAAGDAQTSGSGMLVVLGSLVALTGAVFVVADRRRAARR